MQLSPNFAFLEVHNPQLARLGTLAERYLADDSNTCLIKLRQFGELLAQQVAARVGLYVSIGEQQYELLRRLQARGLIQNQVGTLFDKLHKLRQTGNGAVHELKGDYDTALNHLKYAHQLAIWYHQSFSSTRERDPITQSFIVPPAPEEETQKLRNRLEESQSEAQLAQSLIEAEVKRRQEMENLLHEVESKYQEAVARLEAIQANVVSRSSEEEIQRTIHQALQAEARIPNLFEILTGAIAGDITIEGYTNISQKIETVSTALQTIGTLIGEPQNESLILELGNSIIPGLGIISEANVINKRAQDIQHGIFNLLIIGEFKNGKSTLLNAMLGDKKLPAKATPATAIITMLVYGDKDEVIVYKLNQEKPLKVSWESFIQQFQISIEDQETLKNQNFIDRFKDIDFAQIECRNSLCKSGVRLIDSPGLAEQISRTKISTEFLKQSQAVIVVLNATQPLTQEERNFIESNFRSGNSDHAFFVINMINRVEEDEGEEEVEKIKHYFCRYLQEYFLDSQGNLDTELCKRRIFFVNAKAALNARLKTPIDQRLLATSGVPELERELEQFLTSNQRFKAALSSTFDFLIATIERVNQKIVRDKEALGEPLEALKQRRIEAEQRLQALEARENQIKNIVNLYSKTIADKLCIDLERYILDIENTWQEDSREIINLDRLNLPNLARALFDECTRRLIADDINEGIKKYFNYKFNNWSERIPILIRKEFGELNEVLQTSIHDFSKEIALIEKIFAGKNKILIEIADNQEERIVQLIISLIMGDFSRMPGIVMGDTDWSNFFWESIKQMLLVSAILSIFSGPFEWLVIIISEVGIGFFRESESKKKLVEKIGEKIFERINKQLPELQNSIRGTTERQFKNFGQKVTNVLQEQIDEVRNVQERIIAQKREKTFFVEKEKARLDSIEIEVIALFNKISKLAYGRAYNLEEIQWLAKGKALMMGSETQ